VPRLVEPDGEEDWAAVATQCGSLPQPVENELARAFDQSLRA
jgi:hypothetical protein